MGGMDVLMYAWVGEINAVIKYIQQLLNKDC